MLKVQIYALIVSTVILLGVLELVRSGRLKENYAVLWISTAVAMIFFSLFKNFIDKLGFLVGIYYTPSAFFLMAFLFLTLIIMQFSVAISKLTERNKTLAQELTILKTRMNALESGGVPDDKTA
jgi:hypothetical protein